MAGRAKVRSCTRRKASGQAVVRIHGKDFYCGPSGSPESRKRHQRLIAELFQVEKRDLDHRSLVSELSTNELIVASDEHVRQHYGSVKTVADTCAAAWSRCIKEVNRDRKRGGLGSSSPMAQRVSSNVTSSSNLSSCQTRTMNLAIWLAHSRWLSAAIDVGVD